jgi:hypothetical protein
MLVKMTNIFNEMLFLFCLDSTDRVIQEQTNTLRRSTSPVNGIKSSTKTKHSEVQESNIPKLQKEIQSGFLITDEEEEEPGL